MTCPDCAYHKTRIAHLERELGLKKSVEDFALVKAALGIEMSMVRVVLRLHAARGKWVHKEALMTVISTMSENVMHTRICRLRKLAGADLVETGEKGTRTYRMTPQGVARMDEIIGSGLTRAAA